jgi:chromosome segregation ATPase
VRVDDEVVVGSEIARLKISIARVAARTGITLAGRPSTSGDEYQSSPVAEQKELRRQLAALRTRVAGAQERSEDLYELRAELATLLCFAKTLQDDAERWRSTIDERLREVERKATAARMERERLVAEHEKLVRHRDALESQIVQTAARIAERDRGEWRRTLPVFTLGEGVTVCSISVFRPRKWLRAGKSWLVTLDDAHDRVVVRSE